MSSRKQKTKTTRLGEESIFLPNPYKVLYVDDEEETLRMISRPVDVETIRTDKFQLFLDQLYDAMIAEELPDGWMHAGISAIQVGEPLRPFWAYNGNHDYYDLYINPKVELLGESTWIKEESCLSIPDITGNVRRHKRVRITYYDRDGNKQRDKLTGWNAKVVQHEDDHLNGILFTDKIVED